MDDEQFKAEWKRIHDEHDRFRDLLDKLPPPTEEQRRDVQRQIDDLQRDMAETRRAAEEREERQAEEALRRREADPGYWRRKYEGLVAGQKERDEQKQRERRVLVTMLVLGAITCTVLWLLDRIGWL